MTKKTVRAWTSEQLQQMKVPFNDKILDELLAINTTNDAQKHLVKMFQKSPNPSNCAPFTQEFLQRRFKGNSQFQVYQKPDSEMLSYYPGSEKKTGVQGQLKGKANGGSKGKYVAFDLEKLKEGLLPGRHACTCLASRHKLLGNCTNCGRIICEQEGPGACMTCGNEIFDKKEQARINQKLKEQLQSLGSEQLNEIQKLLQKEEQEKKKAEEFKNKLLDYDRTSARRTKVIDDETDYYSSETNTWLSAKERDRLKSKEQELQQIREEKAKEVRITLDIAGRKVIEADDKAELEQKLQSVYQEELESLNTSSSEPTGGTGFYSQGIFDAHQINLDIHPQFVPVSSSLKKAQSDKSSTKSLKPSRVQHDFDGAPMDIADLSDDTNDPGLCLSMWQPWASLLVYGIKIVEGRNWPTSHRGRLWIAAAAKKAEPTEMKNVIDNHLQIAQIASIQYQKVPKFYPTSCILGCIDITDCLTQVEYQSAVPEIQRQSESAYVFICANPKVLETPIPVSGEHKIWSLDPEVHSKCLKASEKMK